MKSPQKMPLLNVQPEVELEGLIQRIIFHNPDNAFTIVRILPEFADESGNLREGDPVTCKGHMLSPREGARIKVSGHYVKDPRYGRQVVCDHFEEIIPTTLAGIGHYLGCGLIKGVGPSMAARIVRTFGTDTMRILDEEPEKLREIRGIGQKNLASIIESWNEHRGMRDLLLFLQPYGISAAYAVRIYKGYGSESIAVVRENPYRLCMDIRGIGFLTADAIASKLGFPPGHPMRIQAATLYCLQKASEDGHVFLPEEDLGEAVKNLVSCAPEKIGLAINSLEKDKRIKKELLAPNLNAIYLSRFHHCEAQTAHYLKRIIQSPKSVYFDKPERIIEDVLSGLDISLAEQQKKAVKASATNKILVITGGPGTGKTTIIKAVIKIFKKVKASILLAAPTGRAAKRMSEACSLEAKTIHRLLEYSPKEEAFARNEDHPLDCGLLVVDEASMMDTTLFYHLLKALPLGATLILVGDVHQLPSVGPGNVLGDIIDSKTTPVVELNEIFRQSSQSEIICNAHLINHGKMPMLERSAKKLSDFYFIAKDDPEEAADLIVELVKNHIPRRFGYDAINEVQLLTPMHKGAIGAEQMNRRLQTALNPNGLEIKRGDKAFRLHDKVMQVRNNYDKDIFNGDIGRITYIDVKEKSISVDFDGITMPYSFDELEELVPAYAISIHKSQGSEYPAVVIPIMMQHYILLQRNLIYTGVTRGKKLVVLVGESRALQIAVRNNKTSKRHTWLAQRLAGDI